MTSDQDVILKLQTRFNAEVIEQTVTIEAKDRHAAAFAKTASVHREVLRVREEQTRKALIKMGWKPPKGEK